MEITFDDLFRINAAWDTTQLINVFFTGRDHFVMTDIGNALMEYGDQVVVYFNGNTVIVAW